MEAIPLMLKVFGFVFAVSAGLCLPIIVCQWVEDKLKEKKNGKN